MKRIQQQLPSEERAEKQPVTASEKPADATQPRPEKPEPKNIARGIGQAKKGKARYKCAVCLFRVGIGIKSVSKQLRISPRNAIVIRNDAGIAPLKWRMQPGCKPRKGERAKLYEEPKKVKPAKAVLTEEENRVRYEEQKRKARERYYANHEESKRISRENARKRYKNLTPEQKKEHQKQSKEWAKKNPEKVAEWRRAYNKSEQGRKTMRRLAKKYRKQPKNIITRNLRARLRELIKVRSYSTSGLTGCTGDFLAKHIESQFKRGMTWDNYGTYWHIDHILPCAAFDLTDEAQAKQCFNWQNLQPLEASKNIAKSDTITQPQQYMALSFNE